MVRKKPDRTLNFKIPHELHTRLKILAASSASSMQQIIVSGIEQNLSKIEKKLIKKARKLEQNDQE